MEAEAELLAQGLLPGVDYCEHALEVSEAGRLPDSEHVLGCAVCLRRWRVTEAELQGWEPMTHDAAIATVGPMAAMFSLSERDETYRRFYAHLATCLECEQRFAELTFDLAVGRSAGVLSVVK
jgi:hypothetical protein